MERPVGPSDDPAEAAALPPVIRRRYRIEGVVQGVGFRPFVFGTATSLGLSGHVGNDSAGVFCEVQGAPEVVEEFGRRVVSDAPPLARIESADWERIPVEDRSTFRIVASTTVPGALTLVSADLAPCADCLSEMSDRADRRHRYPFINCTNCGPRFTITVDVPYDRPATTMAGFQMCEACRIEYEDPRDRRFHAQPIACPDCGPHVWTEPGTDRDPIAQTRVWIEQGRIVAVKGVGGFHLACRADDEGPVALLRERKGRVEKPFAVMVADIETARQIADVSMAEQRLLTGPERPIVLLRKAGGSPLANGVAPGNGFVGVMLPSSPLHELLLDPGDIWVMTSGNRNQEPICIDNDEARSRLADLADGWLLSDRPIYVPCDDSVVRVTSTGDLSPVRRSRGYAPYPVPIAFSSPPVLAVGGEIKATVCLTVDRHAFMSQHIGDMENLETLTAFDRITDHLTSLFKTEPEVLACDMHPGYLSSRRVRDIADGRPIVEVQHHHAHAAALLAEHRLDGPIIAFSFDGTGYGADGSIWGGEVLVAGLGEFERVGHLSPAPLPGGDAAVRRPYRQALSRLRQAGVDWAADLAPVRAAQPGELAVLRRQLERGINTVDTTSMGRLFDAVSSLCGVRQVVSYEAQAAIELESIGLDAIGLEAIGLEAIGLEAIGLEAGGSYDIDIVDGVWSTDGLIADIVRDLRDGTAPGLVADRFHRSIARAMVDAAVAERDRTGIRQVGLTGGVFQNMRLGLLAEEHLVAAGFVVLTHRLVPCNDGGLALGQAAVAAHTLR